jgi:hypothetical protein
MKSRYRADGLSDWLGKLYYRIIVHRAVVSEDQGRLGSA